MKKWWICQISLVPGDLCGHRNPLGAEICEECGRLRGRTQDLVVVIRCSRRAREMDHDTSKDTCSKCREQGEVADFGGGYVGC